MVQRSSINGAYFCFSVQKMDSKKSAKEFHSNSVTPTYERSTQPGCVE